MKYMQNQLENIQQKQQSNTQRNPQVIKANGIKLPQKKVNATKNTKINNQKEINKTNDTNGIIDNKNKLQLKRKKQTVSKEKNMKELKQAQNIEIEMEVKRKNAEKPKPVIDSSQKRKAFLQRSTSRQTKELEKNNQKKSKSKSFASKFGSKAKPYIEREEEKTQGNTQNNGFPSKKENKSIKNIPDKSNQKGKVQSQKPPEKFVIKVKNIDDEDLRKRKNTAMPSKNQQQSSRSKRFSELFGSQAKNKTESSEEEEDEKSVIKEDAKEKEQEKIGLKISKKFASLFGTQKNKKVADISMISEFQDYSNNEEIQEEENSAESDIYKQKHVTKIKTVTPMQTLVIKDDNPKSLFASDASQKPKNDYCIKISMIHKNNVTESSSEQVWDSDEESDEDEEASEQENQEDDEDHEKSGHCFNLMDLLNNKSQNRTDPPVSFDTYNVPSHDHRQFNLNRLNMDSTNKLKDSSTNKQKEYDTSNKNNQTSSNKQSSNKFISSYSRVKSSDYDLSKSDSIEKEKTLEKRQKPPLSPNKLEKIKEKQQEESSPNSKRKKKSKKQFLATLFQDAAIDFEKLSNSFNSQLPEEEEEEVPNEVQEEKPQDVFKDWKRRKISKSKSNVVKGNDQQTLKVNDRQNRHVRILDSNQSGSKSRSRISSKKLKKLKTVNYDESLHQESHVIHTSVCDRSFCQDGRTKINQYLIEHILGEGQFGEVFLYINEKTSEKFACKKCNKKFINKKYGQDFEGGTSLGQTQIGKEIAVMKKLKHPNVVNLVEVIEAEKDPHIYMVLEFMEKGAILSKQHIENQLRDKHQIAIAKNKKAQNKYVLTDVYAKKYWRDFLLGLDYLHNYAQVCHRDIKPDNLLINEFDRVKIADFGVSEILQDEEDQMNNKDGTRAFMAPETFKPGFYSTKENDIWAAGATLYYFLVGQQPFQGKNYAQLKQSIMNDEPEYPESMDPLCIDLIQKCLKKNTKQRITIKRMMEHSWTTNRGKSELKNDFIGDFKITDEDIEQAITPATKWAMTVKSMIMFKDKIKKVKKKRTGESNKNSNFLLVGLK